MIACAIASISASMAVSVLVNCGTRTSSAAAQRNERHAGAAWVDHDQPLAPAHRQAPDPDDPRISHCCLTMEPADGSLVSVTLSPLLNAAPAIQIHAFAAIAAF